MSGIVQNIQLACAVCRIGVYRLFCRFCCKAPPPPRPEYSPVCIGISGVGKSTLLSLVCGHNVEDIKPTTGFEIKACQFKRCILNVKEIGGGEKVRPYWKHYYGDADGVIFVVDSSCSKEEMEVCSECLISAVHDPQLRGKPCLILGNCQDKPGARNISQLMEDLDVDVVRQRTNVIVHVCQKSDLASIRSAIEKFNELLLGPEHNEHSTEASRI